IDGLFTDQADIGVLARAVAAGQSIAATQPSPRSAT
ncbi:hypothetical protein, partial [Frankia sp. CpI1-P]